jgi:single-stranded-DNA-specific exonuclease
MIEADVTEQALEMAAAQALGAVAVVAGAGWHPGVIGIVASRVKDRMQRPAIVIALQDDGTAKGSGRSVPGVDLGGAVLAAKDSGLLIAGGGHAMAAGLTVETAKIAALTEFLDARLGGEVARVGTTRTLSVDAALAPRGVNLALTEALDAAGPYGQGWAAPRVASGPWVMVKCDIVGENHVRAILSGADGARLKAMAFRAADTPLGVAMVSAGKRPLYLAGRVKRDDWGKTPAAELHLDDLAFAD